MLWLRDLGRRAAFLWPVESVWTQEKPSEAVATGAAPVEPPLPDLARLGDSPESWDDGVGFEASTASVLTPFALQDHGPCLESGEVIGVNRTLFPRKIKEDILLRQNVGWTKYGARLTCGWSGALVALYQELLDGSQYALAAKRPVFAYTLVFLAWVIRRDLETTHDTE